MTKLCNSNSWENTFKNKFCHKLDKGATAKKHSQAKKIQSQPAKKHSQEKKKLVTTTWTKVAKAQKTLSTTNFSHNLNKLGLQQLRKTLSQERISVTTWTAQKDTPQKKKKKIDHNLDNGEKYLSQLRQGETKKNWEQPEQKFDVNKPPCMDEPEKEWALLVHGNTSQIANKPWHKADSPYMTSAEDHLFWRSLINERDLQTNGGGEN